jgi:hypothetical protein
VLPKSKQDAARVDRKRGALLAAATEVFRGAATDQLMTAADVLTYDKGNRPS